MVSGVRAGQPGIERQPRAGSVSPHHDAQTGRVSNPTFHCLTKRRRKYCSVIIRLHVPANLRMHGTIPPVPLYIPRARCLSEHRDCFTYVHCYVPRKGENDCTALHCTELPRPCASYFLCLYVRNITNGDVSVGTAIRLRAGRPRTPGLIPGRGKSFFPSP
jgi:hypothetical protein